MNSEQRLSGPFVITGLSGAGKTVLTRGLEDSGYLCIDNIPLDMVGDLFTRSEHDIERLVVVLDVRTRGLRDIFEGVIKDLRLRFQNLRLVFVEASPESLQRRYSITRRPHPLRAESLARAIAQEEESLRHIRELADLIVDTTNLSPHDLRRQVVALAGVDQERLQLTVEVESFSYMRGVPPTASLVYDVRFLPNPYFEADLRDLAGSDPEVSEWLDGFEEVNDTVKRMADLAIHLLPLYTRELKVDVTVAVGCTGGRHRSVYVAERIATLLRDSDYDVTLHHRDRDRWRYS
ncbi:MAG: RNase adapter RapZ [bacterium]|nr:RNase adapter RapZ [bacterium]